MTLRIKHDYELSLLTLKGETAANPGFKLQPTLLHRLSNIKYKPTVVVNSRPMNSRGGQLGSFSIKKRKIKYTRTCKEGQFKRQVAMQMINKHDSPSSHLINTATTGIRHKWSMNLRMDRECLSVFKKPDGSPAGRQQPQLFPSSFFFLSSV